MKSEWSVVAVLSAFSFLITRALSVCRIAAGLCESACIDQDESDRDWCMVMVAVMHKSQAFSDASKAFRILKQSQISSLTLSFG